MTILEVPSVTNVPILYYYKYLVLVTTKMWYFKINYYNY